ncbi:rho guanine nucleotide exchange factor 12 isoform X2 [Sitophilus oryzae]|uniref:Rho guanine nucleotide exchange factor 12 isoform X2 n=1 Tax=Sitophilus oryzae TaxID=7048 RepID=A0A6J2XWM2_SITOR|nr:rho guanine nucleotide exchange factor 12 isoform X2 [Sitophilus oryzae]
MNNNSPSNRMRSPGAGKQPSLMDHPHSLPNAVRVVVTRDNSGYGMKVSGDNPVFVQSVKEGGPAEKAGLNAGDTILQVNGHNVMQSTHTDVVVLIKSSAQVVLTVQQGSSLSSPGHRPATVSSASRITGPQPVDNEKQHQLQQEREQYYRLMIEKEQHHLDKLRSQLAVSPNEKKATELAKAEKNLRTLQDTLKQSSIGRPLSSPGSITPTLIMPSKGVTQPLPPPPLPKRNKLPSSAADINYSFLSNEINANAKKRNGEDSDHTSCDVPPPLPPRTYPPYNLHTDHDAVNSIDKQMAYPLVATCTSLVSDCSGSNQSKHSRTKSSPDSLMAALSADMKNCKNDNLNQNNWQQQRARTPPGTPPPPYPSPLSERRDRIAMGDNSDGSLSFNSPEESFVDSAHSPQTPKISSSPIRLTNSQTALTSLMILSMEDDISDFENDQWEDHGHFKSLSRLWDHLPHLAVFMNYVLSNCDPNSLLFYLLTDLYKEGNAKEMRKWAFEIHSCFLVPGAPLRLNNVDENIAREIDDDLTKEYEKEEIMRKIFWKARSRAKEELTRQLTDFQHKRTAGLGTIYGPTDSELTDHYNDKNKEMKLYESLFIPKVEMYLEEFEKENVDPPKFYMAAALVTILTRMFKIRSPILDLDRVPTFVNRDRSLKSKIIGRYSRKISHLGHQFMSQQYYTVIPCNNCHQIIYGISPQGYQCSLCLINLHRPCVKLYDDACVGPITRKDVRGLRKLIGMRHDSAEQNRHRKTATTNFIQMEKEKRHQEERDNRADNYESGEAKVSQPVTRKGSDRKTERGCEEAEGEGQGAADKNDDAQMPVERSDSGAQSESSNISQSSGAKKRNTSHINRSESVKEQPEKNRKQQQRRNVSDPSHSFNTSPEADVDRQALSKNADSGSSSNSNISCNGRLSESPSNSMDVHQATVRTQSDSDSDMDGETDPLNWQELVTEEELKKLNPNEKKRQEVINELILTEVSHVRMLKVLYKLFYKTLYNSQILKPDELNLLFPNIKELLDVHSEINKEMRRIRKEDPLVRQIGDVLLATFTGNQGEALQKASATFCERQQLALEFIKRRRERDSKFDAVLTECEKSRQCRRLQLQGIIPVEMQRLTRYSLLLERLVKSVEAAEKVCSDYQDELVKLKQVHQRSKEVLSHVNDAAKLALNKHRLDEIQRHLDVSNFRASDHPIVHDFKNIDLTRYKLILEGNLQLRRPNKALVPVHILLLEEMVVLLQKENDKFILKFFQSGIPGQPALSPIIKMSTLLVRENAVCKNALFLVNTSTTTNVCMYDLQAEDESKRETWRKNFSDAAESYNRREGKLNRGSTITTSSQETASDSDTNSIRDLSTEGEVPEPPPSESTPSPATESPEQPPKTTEPSDSPSPSEDPAGDQTPDVTPGGGIQLTTKVSAEDWPLIQPSQVNVVVPPVHTAESMLTPLEQIRRKDALVKQALAEKENLVADLLSIPREHFEHIADMAASTSDVSMSGASDITDRLLASVFQVDLLQKAVNDAFNITEGEVVAAKGGKKPACASQEPQYANEVKPNVPSIPASQLRDIVTSLSSQLTTLLSEVKLVEEERDRLRKELHKMKEKLHEEHNLHSPVPFDDAASDGSAQEVFCEASSDEPK